MAVGVNMKKIEFKKEWFVLDNYDWKKGVNTGFEMLSFVPAFKKEFRIDEANQSLILSYARAADIIAKQIVADNPDPFVKVFRIDSLVFPFVQLLRHTIEIILKNIYYLCTGNDLKKKTHNLVKTWDEVKPFFIKRGLDSEYNTTENIGLFIQMVNELDPDGAHTKYAKGKDNEVYEHTSKVKYIHVKNLNTFIQEIMVELYKYFKN